jgi:molybdenum cofactor biosynthesis protein B
VLTVSDTRTLETDESGRLAEELCAAAGQAVACRMICPDEPAEVRALVDGACRREDVDAVVVTGGTGIAARDTTHEALAGLYDVAIPGFGELFRLLSFEEVGAAAMLSRASAGVVHGRAVFSLPGSRAAVRLGLTRLVLPELAHVLAQLAGRRE